MNNLSESEQEALNKLKNKLARKVTSRGLVVTDEEIEDEIEDAIEFVNNRRRFKSTSTCLYEKKYNGLIIDLALASIAKIGAEGERMHSENGISRTYDNAGNYPKVLVSRIVPLAGTPE